MYDELVKRLKESKNEQCYIGCFGNCGDCKIDAELEQAANAIEELSKPRWIPVTERLPLNCQDVLAVRTYGDGEKCQEVLMAHIAVSDEETGEKWWNATNITHWMPLPQPPKEET